MDTIQPKIGLVFFFFYARTRRIDPQNNKENEKKKINVVRQRVYKNNAVYTTMKITKSNSLKASSPDTRIDLYPPLP